MPTNLKRSLPASSAGFGRNDWLIFILLAAIGFAVFGNGLNGQFVRDDNIVLAHSFFSAPWSFLKFLGQPYFESFIEAGLYRPLTQISFALNFIFSSKSFGIHLVNVLLHVANSFLVFSLLKKWFNAHRPALITALIFLVLPIHVEAVTSIVGRAELLSLLFSLLAMRSWTNSRNLLSAVFFFFALLSKETAIVVPVVLLFFSGYYHRRLKWLPYHLIAVLAFVLLRLKILGDQAFSAKVEYVFNPLAYSPFWERIATSLKILVLYVQKIFVPYSLSPDYSYNQIPLEKNIFSLGPLLGLLLLSAAVWVAVKIYKKRTNDKLFLALILFLLPCLVISNLIMPIGTIMGDRLMYFPSLGAVILLALFFEKLFFKNRVAASGLLILILISFGLTTLKENRVWAGESAVLKMMYQRSPNSVVAKTNYGINILNTNFDLAKQLSLSAYEQYPDYIQNLNLRGAVEVVEKNYQGARVFLERALKLRPHHQNTILNLNRVYFTLGNYDRAEQLLGELVADYGGAGNTVFYAIVKNALGKHAEAIEVINEYGGVPSDSGKLVIDYANLRLNNKLRLQMSASNRKKLETDYQLLVNSFDYSK